MVVALIALAIALGGTAYAKFSIPPHSIGTPQLKAKAVKSSKIANGAINATTVANGTLTGADINTEALGAVPKAAEASKVADAQELEGGHSASCPAGTKLIGGLCYDSAPSGPVLGVKAAADACAARGGFLPAPGQLLALRHQIPLGDGNGSNAEFTDTYLANAATKSEYFTQIVSEAGVEDVKLENEITHEIIASYDYICVYPLVR